MNKIKISGLATASFIASILTLGSCTTKQETVIIENLIEVPSYPDLDDIKETAIEFKNAEASFYGAYSQTVDRWYVTLTTEDGVSYDLGKDEYSGKGQVLKLCLQTPISGGKASDMKVMARQYICPTSSSDLSIGEFETGYDSSYQHPYYGERYATYGTYFLDLDAPGEYLPLWGIDGAFELKNEGNKWIIEGVILDGSYTKRHFHYEGEMTFGPEYEFPGAPDSVLSQDISLDATTLPKLEIRDRGDQYRYENPPRFSNYRVYLTGENVTVSQTTSKFDVVKLSGEGPVVLLDLFVKPDANGRIPEGDYELVPRLPNSGIDGSLIWPFKFLEGYPHYYFGGALQGCWYFNLGPDGKWKGDYGRITGGSLNISYAEGSTVPTIKASFNDCLTPANKISLDWKKNVQPGPGPVDPVVKDNTIYVRNSNGDTEKEINIASTSSFFTTNGYYAFYLADIPGLNKTSIQNQTIDFSAANVIAANIMFPLNGQTVQLDGATAMRYMLAVSMLDGLSMDFENSFKDEAAQSGCFTLSIDRETNKAVFELEILLNNGKSIYVKATSDYTPGGENESIFLWGDYSRPVLATFYEKSSVAGFEPTLYLTSGQIDYGEDIPRTTYAKISPATSICDGEKHDIAQCLANGTLKFYFRDFDSEWNIVSGEIAIKPLGSNQYEVSVGGLGKEIVSIVGEDKNLNLYYKGSFKDKDIEREVPNVFTYNGKEYNIGSVVIDTRSDIASIYFCQSSGIKTINAAKADNPVTLTVSKSKWTASVGLSTDRDVFSISYDGKTWNKNNLDTGSYIVHNYDAITGLFHCQLANICLQTTYKTVIKLEYKGYPTIIK